MCSFGCIGCGACGRPRRFPTGLTCPSCGHISDKQVAACPKCGAAMPLPAGSSVLELDKTKR